METQKPTRTRKPPIPATPGEFNWTKKNFGIIAKSFEAELPEVQKGMITACSILQLVKIGMKDGSQVVSYLVRKSFHTITDTELYESLSANISNIGLSTRYQRSKRPL